MSWCNCRRGAAAVFCACLGLGGQAAAVTFRWTNTTNTNAWFEVPGNWALVSGSGSPPPLSADTARFNQSATYQVGWDSFTGNRTNAALFVDAGSVTFRSVGGPFTYTLTGNTIANGASLTLGSGSANPHRLQTRRMFVDGSLGVSYGSQASGNAISVGTGFSGTGAVVVDGPGSTLNVTGAGPHYLGFDFGEGILLFQNGAAGNELSSPVEWLAAQHNPVLSDAAYIA